MERMIFHIGTHKTGSSSIQVSLATTSVELLSRGVLYPTAGRISEGGHLNLAWEVASDPRFDPGLGTTSSLLDEIEQVGPHTVILSAETFTSRPGQSLYADWATRLVAELNPKAVLVVGYVRPQWEYIESVYAQQVKQGFITATFDEFLDAHIAHPRYDYRVVFEPWRSQFNDDLIVRPYTNEVVSDFWSMAELGPHSEMIRSNTRPGALEMILLRAVGVWFTDRPQRIRACRRAREWLSQLPLDDVRFQALTEDSVSRISRRYGPANREFAAKYLGNRNHPIFAEPSVVKELPHVKLSDDRCRLATDLLNVIAAEFSHVDQ